LTEDDLDYKTSSQNGDFLPTPKSTIESIQEAQQVNLKIYLEILI